jgi:hypothetical protein
LFTNASVLARVGIAPVNHQTGLQGDVVLGRVLLVLPISRQLVVAVDGDVPHAPGVNVIKVYSKILD